MSRRALGLALTVLMGAPALTVAKPRGPAGDRVWVHPRIDGLRPARIAILPAVSFVYIPRERTYLEDAWLQRLSGSRHAWQPAVLCRERMASTSRRGDSLLNAIGRQVRSRGRVDSTSCRRLARLLQTQALLCLRIDRWERIGQSRSTRIFLDMTATLVDSSGRLLWKVSGEERLESVYGVPKIPGAEKHPDYVSAEDYDHWQATTDALDKGLSIGRPGEMGMTTQAFWVSPDFQAALGRILSRWSRLFPDAPRRVAVSAAG